MSAGRQGGERSQFSAKESRIQAERNKRPSRSMRLNSPGCILTFEGSSVKASLVKLPICCRRYFPPSAGTPCASRCALLLAGCDDDAAQGAVSGRCLWEWSGRVVRAARTPFRIGMAMVFREALDQDQLWANSAPIFTRADSWLAFRSSPPAAKAWTRRTVNSRSPKRT